MPSLIVARLEAELMAIVVDFRLGSLTVGLSAGLWFVFLLRGSDKGESYLEESHRHSFDKEREIKYNDI